MLKQVSCRTKSREVVFMQRQTKIVTTVTDLTMVLEVDALPVSPQMLRAWRSLDFLSNVQQVEFSPRIVVTVLGDQARQALDLPGATDEALADAVRQKLRKTKK